MSKWNEIPDHNNLYANDFVMFLPEENDRVCYLPCPNWSIDCLFTDGKEIHKGQVFIIIGDDREIEVLQWLTSSDSMIVENVTHWRPLPELPH